MLDRFFHAWERRLASDTKDRVVRPFEWGLDWIPQNGHRAGAVPSELLGEWVSGIMTDTDAFFTPPPTDEYELAAPSRHGDRLLDVPGIIGKRDGITFG